MKNLALLEYLFLLDPTETYTNVFQFEAELNNFFNEKGMCAKAVSPVAGANGRRIIIIEKKEEVETTQDEPKQMSVNQRLATLAPNKGFDGKFKR